MENWKSEKQVNAEKDELIKSQAKQIKEQTMALERIVKTYDNVEDLAGVIARETLDKFK
jgi:hypothetical protein